MKKQALGNTRSVAPVHALGALACCAVVAGAAVMLFLPGVRNRDESRQQVARFDEVSRQLERATQANRELTQRVQRIEASVESRRGVLAPQSDLNRRLAALTALCVESGLNPGTILPQTPEKGAITTVIPIRFDVSGTPAAIYALIGRFDREYPDLHMDSIAIEHVRPETVRLRTVLNWHTADVN